MNANRFDVVVGLVSPHFFEDQRGGHGLTVALEQAVEQLEFQVRQAYRAVEPDGFEPLRHQGEWAVAEDLVVIGGAHGCAITPAQQGFDPRLKFLEVEGLGQVVVSP